MDKLFDCHQCNGPVHLMGGEGRIREYRPGIELTIPEHIRIPTCVECGESYLTTAEAEELEQALKPTYAEYCRKLIHAATTHGSVSLKELECAAGVTRTYFSHVVSGRKQPSLALVRLLQAFAIYPEEIHRHLSGGAWEKALQGDWHHVSKLEARYMCNTDQEPVDAGHVACPRRPIPVQQAANWENCKPLEGPTSTPRTKALAA